MNVLEVTGDSLKKIGSARGSMEYAGPCPGCGGTDRFRVWPEKREGEGSYWCRMCGKAGDLVQFFVDFQGMDYPTAFRAAGREPLKGQSSAYYYRQAASKAVAGDMIKGATTPGENLRSHDTPVETWQVKARTLVDWSHKQLLKNNDALQWLKDRGIGMNEIKSFSLGWLPGENGKGCSFRPRESWGLPTEYKDNGKKKMLWIPRGLVIPMITANGVERVRIRRPNDDIRTEKDIRYYTLPGSSMAPLVADNGKRAWVVVESDLDAILVAGTAGAVTNVAALGTASAKPDPETFGRLQASLRVLVALDSDEAGAKAFEWWAKQMENARRWPVPDGKDPGEAYQAGVDILSWVMEGFPPALTIQYKAPSAAGKTTSPADPPREKEREKPAEPEAEPESKTPAKEAEPAPQPKKKRTVLDEVADILRTWPVKISTESCVPRLIYTDGFTDETAKARLHQLVCFNNTVLDYLYKHHATMIHRGNFDKTAERRSE
ncbi:MAG: toprim domain-containing protein [Desulfobacteraceae bacterium]|nr:toprim domain-containing protein [Desulfobacteraceae bacterium]